MEPIALLSSNFESSTRYKWSDFRTDNVKVQELSLSETNESVIVCAKIVVPNEGGMYDISSVLCDATTQDYVAEATRTNVVLHAGTNAVSLAFTNGDIQMNAVSNVFAINKFTVEKDGEIVAAYNGDATLNVADETILNPTNAVLVFDEATVTNELVAAGGGALYSGVNFAFDVENSYTNVVDYTLTAYLYSTNSLMVDMATFDLSLTSGVNRITIPFLGAKIKAAEIDGPYVLSCVRLESKDDAIASQTLRMSSTTEVCAASDFQGNVIERIVNVSRMDNVNTSIVVNVSFETSCAVSGAVKASLLDAENKVVMFGWADFVANIAGMNDVEIRFAITNILASVYSMPLRVTYISIEPDDKLVTGISDDAFELEITELYTEQSAPPVFSPTTRTVFFGSSQPVVISCATPEAEIRYTLDGTEPTESSLIYDGSLVISNSVTLKARAFAEYMRPSEIVQAEYIHAAIVGGNLAQSDTLSVGVPQTLNIPAPGAYKASFDYSQGGDVELRLVGNGFTNTLAVISATSAGSTNFLFEVTEAGRYELLVFDPSSGTTQPVTLSGLNIYIPDTERNRSRYWIYETESTFGSTGEWIAEYGFVNGKMLVEVRSVFSATQKSSGRNVTIQTTVEFDEFTDSSVFVAEHEDMENAKEGIRLALHGDNASTFQVLSFEDGQKTWLDVNGVGLTEPTLNTPYTFKFTLDNTNKTYQVALVGAEGEEMQLTHGTTNRFSFADVVDSVVGEIEYQGCGTILSLQGRDNSPADSFMQGDTLPFEMGHIPAITEGQAAWLNSMNSYDVVKAKVSSMSGQDLDEACLLNLDITQDVFGLDLFKVSGVEVTETEVRIHVWLNRTGAIQVGNDDVKRNAPINGILKLYGGTVPQTKDLLNAAIMTDSNFADGDTTTIIYPRSGNARFFRPVIESRTE